MKSRLLIPVVFAALACLPAAAQEDEPSLGDVARQLRQHKPQGQDSEVIDNDNLAQATADAHSVRAQGAEKFVLSVEPGGRIKASSPDVSCSLSFNARAGALLV